MTEQQNDRRRNVRVVFRTTARVIFSGERTFADCETADVSVSGVFVKGAKDAGPGEKCLVELQLTGKTSNLLLKMTGEVVRVQDDGIALEFCEVDEDSFYHLQNIVYFSYKHAGEKGDLLTDIEDVADETLYHDLDGGGKATSLPDNYLDGLDESGGDDFDEDFTYSIAERIKHRQDEEDY